MSHALRACLLIRLDARAGTEVSVEDLARHLQLWPITVRTELAAMWQEGLIELVQDEGGIHAAKVGPL